MANIPVERKGGMPGWVWLLLALLLALLLLLLLGDGCSDDADDEVLTGDTTAYVAPPVTTPADDLTITGPADIEELDSLFARGEAGDIAGQSVRFTNVVAYNVTGDSTFYVQSGSNQAFVVLRGLGESQSGMGAADGQYAIEEGDTLDLMGRVRALDDTMRAGWTIRPEAAQGYYVDARRVTN